MTTEQEPKLREALRAAYPAADMPEALRRRVAALAGEAAARVPRQARRRNGLRLLGAGAAVLLLLALLSVPRLTAVQAYQRMTDSLRDVRSAHLTTWEVLPNGTRRKWAETWYQAGRWHRELNEVDPKGGGSQPTSVEICRDGNRWTYDIRRDTVTLERAALPSGMEGTTGFSIAAGIRSNAAWGLRTQVRMLGTTTLAGRPAHILELVSKEHFDMHTLPNTRSRVVVDNATDLPMRSESQMEKNGRWITNSVSEMQYNAPLSAALFAPDFPKQAQFVDAVAGREEWRKRLAEGVASGIAGTTSDVITYPDGHGLFQPKIRGTNTPTRVVVRDFQVNARGDVFLLFTANHAVGYGGDMVNATLTDDVGTKYINPALQKRSRFVYLATNLDRTDGSKLDGGYLFNNEMLEGLWWVPENPQQNPWKPRRFTLTLSLPFAGGYGKPAAVFDLAVGKPGSDNLPGYMPYMSRPLPGDWMEKEEAETRAYYYQHDAHDLPQALAWYRKTISLNSVGARKFGYKPYNAYQWFDVYQVLMEMGRPEEAKAALLRAKADDDRALSPTETRAWIRAAMKERGMTP